MATIRASGLIPGARYRLVLDAKFQDIPGVNKIISSPSFEFTVPYAPDSLNNTAYTGIYKKNTTQNSYSTTSSTSAPTTVYFNICANKNGSITKRGKTSASYDFNCIDTPPESLQPGMYLRVLNWSNYSDSHWLYDGLNYRVTGKSGNTVYVQGESPGIILGDPRQGQLGFCHLQHFTAPSTTYENWNYMPNAGNIENWTATRTVTARYIVPGVTTSSTVLATAGNEAITISIASAIISQLRWDPDIKKDAVRHVPIFTYQESTAPTTWKYLSSQADTPINPPSLNSSTMPLLMPTSGIGTLPLATTQTRTFSYTVATYIYDGTNWNGTWYDKDSSGYPIYAPPAVLGV